MSISVVNDLARDSEKHATRAAILGAVSGLRERILALVDRVGGSQRELSRKAGLTEVHVGQIIRRLEKDPEARIEKPTLDAIAKGASVSAAWLSHGVGSPDSDDTPSVSEDRRPELRNLPGWEDALSRAKLLHPQWPEWVWAEVGQASTFSAPVADVPILVDIAQLVLRHAGQGKQDLAADARRAEQIAHRAEIAASVTAIQEGTIAPPRPPPEVKPPRGRR